MSSSVRKTQKTFPRNLPHKARISIFNGKKELETFINDESQPERSKLSLSPKKKDNSDYLMDCQSIYEKFSMKKGKPRRSTHSDPSQTIVSLKRIKFFSNNFIKYMKAIHFFREVHRSNKSVFSSSTRRELKMKKNKLQDFLKNDIIDFEKIQNLYFETKNDNSRSEKIPPYFLEVVEVFSLNSILKEFKSYYDFYPFLNARRFMKLFIGY